MMAMKIRITRPVESRVDETTWSMLFTVAAPDGLIGRTSHFVGASRAAVEVPARTSRSSIASEPTALPID